MFRFDRLKVDWSGVFSVFSIEFLLSEFWTALLVPYPDEPVIDHTANPTGGLTTLTVAVKKASSMRFLTVLTAMSTAFIIFSSKLLPMI